MGPNASFRNAESPSVGLAAGLGPLFFIVFFGFLAIGASLPALAVQLHAVLGFSASIVGWVIGLQSLVTVLSRHNAGTLCDGRGPKGVVMAGLPVTALAGIAYLFSAHYGRAGGAALPWILAGRVLLGLGESLFITGAMSWGIARLGPERTGKVMAWQGIAMYSALGLGAPLGLELQKRFGFTGVAGCVIALPLFALVIAWGLPPVSASGGRRVPFYRVFGLIWQPGMILALATTPFAVLATFLALYYANLDWQGAGTALAGFGAGYVFVRLFFAHLPDRFGGAKVGVVSLAIELAGQLLLWWAPVPLWALVGTVMTGVGFSLIFPSMGVEATRRVAPEQRGQAVGNFIAFFDFSLGLTGPLVGLLVARAGYSVIFAAGSFIAATALVMMVSMLRQGSVAAPTAGGVTEP